MVPNYSSCFPNAQLNPRLLNALNKLYIYFRGLNVIHHTNIVTPSPLQLSDFIMSSSRHALAAAAQSFCDAFSQKQKIPIFLSHFSNTHQVSAIEHGETCLAPFLGRRFTGLLGVQEYFKIVGSLLSYGDIAFSEFIVDTDANRVAVKGKGRFTWLSTGNSWDETFAYVLSFDDELKVTE